MALKQVKNKIIATKKTGKVTKAMEAVSAVKMRKSQEKAMQSRPYVRAAMRILSRVSDSTSMNEHALTTLKPTGRKLVVIVTSDKGLAGSVNSAVLKQVEILTRSHPDIDTVCVGRKAAEFAAREKKTIVKEFVNVHDDVTLDDVYDITEGILAGFSDGTYNTVDVVYQNFISTFEQQPVVRQVLPLTKSEVEKVMAGIASKGVKKVELETTAPTAPVSYEVEPSSDEVLNTLLPKLAQILIYHALIESKACEHSARMVAMKNATDKAKDMAKSLTLIFNKQRQAMITAEVSEITGGIEAMK